MFGGCKAACLLWSVRDQVGNQLDEPPWLAALVRHAHPRDTPQPETPSARPAAVVEGAAWLQMCRRRASGIARTGRRLLLAPGDRRACRDERCVSRRGSYDGNLPDACARRPPSSARGRHGRPCSPTRATASKPHLGASTGQLPAEPETSSRRKSRAAAPREKRRGRASGVQPHATAALLSISVRDGSAEPPGSRRPQISRAALLLQKFSSWENSPAAA